MTCTSVPRGLRASTLALITFALAIGLAGCGDDDGSTTETGMDMAMPDAAPGDAGMQDAEVEDMADAGPDFPDGAIVCSWTFTPDGVVSFLRFIPDAELDSGEVIDATGEAIELGGPTFCSFVGNSVFVHEQQTPTITRYDLMPDGTLAEIERVGLMSFGVTGFNLGFGTQPPVFADRGFHVDEPTQQIAVWDPRSMTTIGAIPVEGFEPPVGSELATGGFRVLTVGDDLLLVGSFRSTENDLITNGLVAGLVERDAPDTLRVGSFDDRCGNAQRDVARDTSGNVYFTLSSVAAVQHALGLDNTIEPCVLRIAPGDVDFDPDYSLALNTVTGGRPTHGFIPLEDGRALVLAFDTDAMPIDPELSAAEIVQIPNWDYYVWEVGTTNPATLVPELTDQIGFFNVRTYDGRTFLLNPDLATGGATLVDLSERPFATRCTFGAIFPFFAPLAPFFFPDRLPPR
ncbi:MAG: hypothetical protein AAGH15_27655, partial [Myxococcota bacterium]